MQLLATQDKQFHTALSTSVTILEYIRTIDMANDLEKDVVEDCDICLECEAREALAQEITSYSGMPIELVRRVLEVEDRVLAD